VGDEWFLAPSRFRLTNDDRGGGSGAAAPGVLPWRLRSGRRVCGRRTSRDACDASLPVTRPPAVGRGFLWLAVRKARAFGSSPAGAACLRRRRLAALSVLPDRGLVVVSSPVYVLRGPVLRALLVV